jgi:magnesium transporter
LRAASARPPLYDPAAFPGSIEQAEAAMSEQRDDWLPDMTPDGQTVGLTADQVQAVVHALDEDHPDDAAAIAAELHPAELADLIEQIGFDDRVTLVEQLRPETIRDVLPELDESIADELLEVLPPEAVAAAVADLDSDDAVEVMENLEDDDRERVLAAMGADDRAAIERSLEYPEESAGRLMQRELVAVPEFWSVGETIDYLRNAREVPEVFYDIFVVDPRHRPLGMIPLSQVLRARRPVKLADIMEEDRSLVTISVEMDQEDVAYLFRQQDLTSAAVIDGSGRLLGQITIDDVVDVIDEEHEEDLMKLSGLVETDLFSDMLATARSRFTWLLVNLGTAFLASAVISMFGATIEQIVALAILMPIVASMGGNAGTQTLTVAVRSLAMKDLTATNALRFVGKELVVGAVNGIMFALLVGLAAWFWFDDPAIGAVIAAAMIINLVVAGLFGTLIPLGLERAGADPAIASTVFLTTVTDVIGFLAFLGLAALVLL